MADGLFPLPWWGYVAVTLAFTHVTVAAVTIYLHRHQAHRSVDLHPGVAHCCRAWLWLTTGLATRAWAAVHRKHHACVETPDDPHSPRFHGLRKVLLEGAELYRIEAADPETIQKYGHGAPDDWIERRLYTRCDNALGLGLMLVVDIALFGAIGVTIWAVQMAWIPFFAAGVINGVGHWRGYRNFETPDASANLVPWGVLIGGEELHNNHHAFASSARFSVKAWELDLGWAYLRALARLGLARINKLAPRLGFDKDKALVDLDTLSAVVTSHLIVMAEYARQVVHRVHREELRRSAREVRMLLRPSKRLLVTADRLMSEQQRSTLAAVLAQSRPLEQVYQFQQRLRQIFAERSASEERLLAQLQEWCRQAEETGILALREFARTLRGYTLEPAVL